MNRLLPVAAATLLTLEACGSGSAEPAYDTHVSTIVELGIGQSAIICSQLELGAVDELTEPTKPHVKVGLPIKWDQAGNFDPEGTAELADTVINAMRAESLPAGYSLQTVRDCLEAGKQTHIFDADFSGVPSRTDCTFYPGQPDFPDTNPRCLWTKLN